MTARTVRIPAGLPYASVMAAAGAGSVAADAGRAGLAVALLWLAIVEAAVVAIGAVVRRWRLRGRTRYRADAPGGSVATSGSSVADRTAPRRRPRFGLLTVPVGLAVVGAGMVRLALPGAAVAAPVLVLAAWAATVHLTAHDLGALRSARGDRPLVDGAWFLLPAATLADALGAAAIVRVLPAWLAVAARWGAVGAAVVGFVGYALVLVLAGVRVARRGLGPAPGASWWIAAGCGGLAADTASAVSDVAGGHAAAAVAVVAAWAVGTVLLVPIVAGSIRYVARRRALRGAPLWQPTFSTAVYALGTARVGDLAALRAVDVLTDAAGVATVALWAVTALLWVWARAAGGRRPA